MVVDSFKTGSDGMRHDSVGGRNFAARDKQHHDSELNSFSQRRFQESPRKSEASHHILHSSGLGAKGANREPMDRRKRRLQSGHGSEVSPALLKCAGL